jgi:hypothetical protein
MLAAKSAALQTSCGRAGQGRPPANGEDFLYKPIKGAPAARRTWPVPSQVACGSRGITEGERELAGRETAGATPRQQGDRLRRGGSLPRPTGDGPPGAALPPVGSPATGGQAVPPPMLTLMTAPALLAEAVLLAPGIVSPRKITVKGAPAARPSALLRADP